MLKELLAERAYLPILRMNDGRTVTRENWEERRGEMKELLAKYSYGHTPKDKVRVTGEVRKTDRCYCAGKCVEETVYLFYETEQGKSCFPIQIYTPTTVERPPVLLHISFGMVPQKYNPVEEIIDHGYALVVVDYAQMVNDSGFGDYSDGIAAHFGTGPDRGDEEWGKIGMWAWGASRVMDYLCAERPQLDTERVAVVGHSRLGKTALWCAAQDMRFAAVISNDSGYGGAASSKRGEGERIDDFLKAGSWDWFCENFKSFRGEKEDEKPYDQSFLLSLIAPRLLIVGSAELDRGADPKSEFLTTLHASSAWELLGEEGLVTPDALPIPPTILDGGKVCYHIRHGLHWFSREDWLAYIKILDKKWK